MEMMRMRSLNMKPIVAIGLGILALLLAGSLLGFVTRLVFGALNLLAGLITLAIFVGVLIFVLGVIKRAMRA